MLRRFYSTSLAMLSRQCDGNSTMYSGASYQSAKQNILKETKISREHLTPEIGLHLITTECRLFHEPLTDESVQVFSDPFWGFYWPGGQALSRYILDNPSLVEDKSILDVGSGCAASSLAALMCNAKYAKANDIDEVAGCAALLNATLNGISSEKLLICSDNLIGLDVIDEDLVFLGDVFYDEEFALTLLPWLHQLQRRGKQILIGDPGRHGLTEGRLGFMEKLATYELLPNCCIENNGFKFVNVWQFKNKH